MSDPMPSVTRREQMARYADLVVRMGINVQSGQDVFLQAEAEQLDLVRLVVDRAYAAGARRVLTDLTDDHFTRSAIVHGAEETLRSTYRHELEMVEEFRERGAAALSITSVPDPDFFAGLDPALVTARRTEFLAALTGVLGRGEMAWTVAAAPSEPWATAVFGSPDVDRLWDALSTAMRLDQPDPVASWQQRIKELEGRRDWLNGLHLQAIIFKGPGTELTVPLVEGAVWHAGGMDSTSGTFFMPNLPTEEVFTSPDWRRSSGTGRITSPVAIGSGAPVIGLQLTLEDGRITDIQADTGCDLVLAELEQDAQARYLGEVALVDSATSAVARAGVLFHHPLLDENVSSHIAWGSAYEITVPSLIGADDERRLAGGLNVSGIHTDVPIGGSEVEIQGILADGSRIPLISGDDWVGSA